MERNELIDKIMEYRVYRCRETLNGWETSLLQVIYDVHVSSDNNGQGEHYLESPGIYRIWNTKTGKSYVGQSGCPYRRIYGHLSPYSKQDGSSEVRAAVLKHGIDAFDWEILEFCHSHELNALEQKYIKHFDSIENGYNKFSGEYRGETATTQFTNLNNRRVLREKVRADIKAYKKEAWHSAVKRFSTEMREREIISQYGSLEAYEQWKWEQEIISQHGSLEAYERWRTKQAKIDNTIEWLLQYGYITLMGSIMVFGLIVLLIKACSGW